jgi:protein TonB
MAQTALPAQTAASQGTPAEASAAPVSPGAEDSERGPQVVAGTAATAEPPEPRAAPDPAPSRPAKLPRRPTTADTAPDAAPPAPDPRAPPAGLLRRPANPDAAHAARSAAAKIGAVGGKTARGDSARRSATDEPAPEPAPSEPDHPETRSGLAALDAEIAAMRARVLAQARGQSARARAPERPGLAALDAEIAAERRRAHAGGPNSASGGAPAPRAGHTDAGPERSGSAPAGARDRGRAERRYLDALRRALVRERHYPPTARRRRLEGTAQVQFTIAADGAFSGIHVSHSAGVASLDEAAAVTVRRLARFEPIPAAIGRSRWTVRVPIVFRLN